MSFQQLNPSLFLMQAEFIRKMEAPRDFIFWAETLVTEELTEFLNADKNNEGMEQIFKEGADLLYVICGFYNTMPRVPQLVMTEEQSAKISEILDRAAKALSDVSLRYNIPMVFFEEAFVRVHESNMSKLGEDGKPIRREDGKILKGPNYKAPDMAPIVKLYEEFLQSKEATGEETNEADH